MDVADRPRGTTIHVAIPLPSAADCDDGEAADGEPLDQVG
jgi:hypothetical protein